MIVFARNTEPIPGDADVRGVDVVANVVTTEFSRGERRRARTHEGIQNEIAASRSEFDAPPREIQRHNGRMPVHAAAWRERPHVAVRRDPRIDVIAAPLLGREQHVLVRRDAAVADTSGRAGRLRPDDPVANVPSMLAKHRLDEERDARGDHRT